MYIYNVTINVEDNIHEEWLEWIKPHIKEVIATGKFTKAKMTQVLVDEEMGGTTYSIQYTSPSRELLDRYYEEDAPKLRTDGLARFDNKMLAFRTELKVIEEF
ncbi:MAG: DUF4286 family protein [Flavobacteriaceae bacterium]|nr:DUF4286 family protein [Flavobacteriaceae bacterium]